jgi:hypothetical protein
MPSSQMQYRPPATTSFRKSAGVRLAVTTGERPSYPFGLTPSRNGAARRMFFAEVPASARSEAAGVIGPRPA